MHDLAVISTIKSIAPIEGKDRIVVANVENYNCIVNKEDFKVGDKVIYVYYDSILPEKPEFEFLRKRCWSEKFKGFRIRPMKMGNVISEGLVLPLNILPKCNYRVGDVVTDKLGIRLYDPEAKAEPVKHKGIIKLLCRYKWFRNLISKRDNKATSYPSWIIKSDEENIEKCYDKVKDLDITYQVSEKVEGCATVYAINKGKFEVYSHNRRVTSDRWVDYANQINLSKKLKAYCKSLKLKGIAISGELIGPKIQSNIYERDNLELYIYGGYALYKDNSNRKLTISELRDASNVLGIPTVPYIGEAKIEDLDKMLKDCEGYTVLVKDKKVPREGLVYRSADGKVHFKVKSRSYKIWFEKKEPIE